MKINFELHRDDDLLLLEGQDVYKFFDENNPKHQTLMYYLEKWMEYLNYPLLHNTEMAFDDGYYKYLYGLINGLAYALHINFVGYGKVITIKCGRYTINMPKPFALEGEEK